MKLRGRKQRGHGKEHLLEIFLKRHPRVVNRDKSKDEETMRMRESKESRQVKELLTKKSESNVKENGEETNNVEVHIKGKVATVQDLFTRERKNIKVDEISYSSGIAIETRRNNKIIEYKKVYRCLMVLNKKKEGVEYIGEA
jgi:hypothetical protein